MTKCGDRRTQVVVVDDDPQMTRIFMAALRTGFGETLAAEAFNDAASALARIEAGQVDVVVTDLDMPAWNGLQILRLAKQRNASTQVIVATGKSSHGALLEALELGAADYLVKPVDRTALIEVVQQATRRVERWRRALAETWNVDRGAAAIPPASMCAAPISETT